MKNLRLYEMVREGKEIKEIREELELMPSDLRALIILMKRMGLNVKRERGRYFLGEPIKMNVILRSPLEKVVATLQATKVLRFLYGEKVTMVWPNAVALGDEIIAEVRGPALEVNGVDEHLEAVIVKRTRDALRAKKFGEVIRDANFLLYDKAYGLILKGGEEIKTKVNSVNIYGNAKTESGEIRAESVETVRL